MKILLLIIITILGSQCYSQKSEELFFDQLETVDTLWFTIDYDCGASVNTIGNEQLYALYKNSESYSLMKYIDAPIKYKIITLKKKEINFIRNLELKSRNDKLKRTRLTLWEWHYKEQVYTSNVYVKHQEKMEKLFK